jgi:hypothetical protein
LRWSVSDGALTANWFHKLLAREGWPDYEFAFHDNEELGRRILSRIGKHTGLLPEDL